MTILFADIAGFTPMAEALGAEEITHLTNQCFGVLAECVERYRGTIDKFLGDCVMALFGAPMAHEDDAERALRCALDMLEAIKRVGGELGRSLDLTIGVNTGIVVAGEVGSERRRDYTVMGDAVNIAQRLQGAAAPGQVFAGPQTYQLARQAFHFEDLAPMQLKGLAEPLQVYRLVRAKRGGSMVVARRRPQGPIVVLGREREVGKILEIMEMVGPNSGHAIGICGESGTGKSALADVVIQEVGRRGMEHIEAHCSAYSTRTAYQPFVQIVRQILRIEETSDRKDILSKLRALSGPGLGSEEIEAMQDLMALPLEETGIQYLDPEARTRNIIHAMRALLRGVFLRRGGGKAVVVIEQVQWMDAPSLELLNNWMQDISDLPVGLVLTFRPDFEHHWSNLVHYHQINLRRLSDKETVSLASHFLDGKMLDAGLAAHLVKGADGNPLFLSEMISMLKEGGLIEEQEGTLLLKPGVDRIDLPVGVMAILSSWLDHLDAHHKEVLEYGAVIGQPFAVGLLRRLVPNLPRLDEMLNNLVRGGFLRALGGGREPSYCFRREIVREVILQRILRKRLKEMHHEIAGAYEAMQPHGVHERAESLARHYSEAGVLERAVISFEKTGDRQYSAGDFAGSVGSYDQAMRVSDATPTWGKLTFKRARSLALLGQWREAESALRQALGTKDASEGAEWRPSGLVELGKICRDSGRLEEAATFFESAAEAAKSDGDTGAKVEAIRHLADIEVRKGRLSRAFEILKPLVAQAGRIQNKAVLAKLYNDIGNVTQKMEELIPSEEFYQRSLSIKQSIGERLGIEVTLGNLGDLYRRKRDFKKASEYYLKAMEAARDLEDKLGVAVNLHNTGAMLFEQGNMELARVQCDVSLMLAEKLNWSEGKLLNSLYLGRLDAVGDAAEKGVEQIRSTVRTAEVEGNQDALALGYYFLAELCHAQGRDAEAREYLGKLPDPDRVWYAHDLLDKIKRLRSEIDGEHKSMESTT